MESHHTGRSVQGCPQVGWWVVGNLPAPLHLWKGRKRKETDIHMFKYYFSSTRPWRTWVNLIHRIPRERTTQLWSISKKIWAPYSHSYLNIDLPNISLQTGGPSRPASNLHVHVRFSPWRANLPTYHGILFDCGPSCIYMADHYAVENNHG